MIRLRLLLILCVNAAVTAFAQSQVAPVMPQQPPTRAEQIVEAYTDSLSALRQRFAAWQYAAADTLSNPYYFPVFAAAVYQPEIVGSAFGSRPYRQGYDWLAATYAAYPSLVEGFMGTDDGKMPPAPAQQDVASLDAKNKQASAKVEIKAPEEAPLQIVVRRPNFWKFSEDFSLKFMQTHISDNWYRGGNSNMFMQISATIDANYNNKQKVKFENRLEMRLGFVTEKGDELHRFKTNDDLLRLTNRFGLQAAKNLYYTATLQSWTQFYPSYHANDPFVYSDFMSPFESLLTVGMEYKVTKKKFSISATLSPLALDFKYVGRTALITRFGLPAGQHSDWYFGSNILVETKWDIWKNISWRSRLYYFTNYQKVQAEWEHTFDLRINKYLTTQLFLHPRFDDSVNRGNEYSYWQFKEYFALNVNVKF